jgi:hypothetical protein
MKTKSEEAKNLDQFLSDMSEVFEVPKRTLKKMMYPFDEEPTVDRKESVSGGVQPSEHVSPAPRI